MAVKFKDDDDASSKEHKERVQAQERHVLCGQPHAIFSEP